MVHRRFLCSFAVLAFGTPHHPAAAQTSEKDKICSQVENRPLVDGTWAGYTWTSGQSRSSQMRVAVVGSEAQAGTTFHWFEVTIDDGRPNSKMIVQMLTPGLGAKASEIRSVVLKTGTQPAMRMPRETIAMVSAQLGTNYLGQISRECHESDVVGWEQTTVPAGNFRAMHLHNARNGVDVWVQPSLAFPLVKTTMKDGQVLVLSAQGTGAKSSITETPVDMPGIPGTRPPR